MIVKSKDKDNEERRSRMEMARMASKKGGRKSWELVQSLSGKSFHPSEGGALSS